MISKFQPTNTQITSRHAWTDPFGDRKAEISTIIKHPPARRVVLEIALDVRRVQRHHTSDSWQGIYLEGL